MLIGKKLRMPWLHHNKKIYIYPFIYYDMDIKNASLEKLKAMAFDIVLQRRQLGQQDQQLVQKQQAIENLISQKIVTEQEVVEKKPVKPIK